MSKAGTLDDNVFPATEKPKQKRGAQEDGTFITSTGKVLPAKNRTRREPYPEPEDKQVDGHTEIVETPSGDVSFHCTRMTEPQWRKAGTPERKRLRLMYVVDEVYAGKPRQYYSYDELEQIRKGEMKK